MKKEYNTTLGYMAESARKLIEKNRVEFKNEDSFKLWCSENAEEIAKGASKLQQELMAKINKHEEKVKKIMSDKIYFEINRREMKKKEAEAYKQTLLS